MLYWLTALSDGGDFFNLFQYITFRAGGAFLTALTFGFIFGRPLIDVLRKRQGKGQPIREDGPEGHFVKAGTPTMGGLLIVGALLTSTLLWARWDNPYVWMILFVTLGYALIGFADDYAKVSKQNTSGVSGRVRLGLGFLIAAIAAVWAGYAHPEDLSHQLAVPIFKDVLFDMSILFIPFAMIVIVGAPGRWRLAGPWARSRWPQSTRSFWRLLVGFSWSRHCLSSFRWRISKRPESACF